MSSRSPTATLEEQSRPHLPQNTQRAPTLGRRWFTATRPATSQAISVPPRPSSSSHRSFGAKTSCPSPDTRRQPAAEAQPDPRPARDIRRRRVRHAPGNRHALCRRGGTSCTSRPTGSSPSSGPTAPIVPSTRRRRSLGVCGRAGGWRGLRLGARTLLCVWGMRSRSGRGLSARRPRRTKSGQEMVLVEIEKEFWGPRGLGVVDQRLAELSLRYGLLSS